MRLFASNITVVNYYRDTITKETMYFSTVLKDCMIRKKVDTAPTNNTLNTVDYYSITIPYQDGYLSPYDYHRLPNDQMSGKWTLDTEEDLIILGEFIDPIDNDIYIKLLKRDDVGVIRSVSDNTTVPLLKHWKVIAK